MTDTKHTPGPWYFGGAYCVCADVPQDIDHTKFRGFDKPDYGLNGDKYLIAESIPHEPTRKLIAAAPELLAALKSVLDHSFNRKILTKNEVKAYDKARAAIAKAKGES